MTNPKSSIDRRLERLGWKGAPNYTPAEIREIRNNPNDPRRPQYTEQSLEELRQLEWLDKEEDPEVLKRREYQRQRYQTWRNKIGYAPEPPSRRDFIKVGGIFLWKEKPYHLSKVYHKGVGWVPRKVKIVALEEGRWYNSRTIIHFVDNSGWPKIEKEEYNVFWDNTFNPLKHPVELKPEDKFYEPKAVEVATNMTQAEKLLIRVMSKIRNGEYRHPQGRGYITCGVLEGEIAAYFEDNGPGQRDLEISEYEQYKAELDKQQKKLDDLNLRYKNASEAWEKNILMEKSIPDAVQDYQRINDIVIDYAIRLGYKHPLIEEIKSLKTSIQRRREMLNDNKFGDEIKDVLEQNIEKRETKIAKLEQHVSRIEQNDFTDRYPS